MTTTNTEHHANLDAAISRCASRSVGRMDPKEVLEVLQEHVRELAAKVQQSGASDSKNG